MTTLNDRPSSVVAAGPGQVLSGSVRAFRRLTDTAGWLHIETSDLTTGDLRVHGKQIVSSSRQRVVDSYYEKDVTGPLGHHHTDLWVDQSTGAVWDPIQLPSAVESFERIAMAQWFRNSLVKLINKEVDYDSDNIAVTLHTSTYAPNLDTHDYVDDLTNELAASGGYSTGGVNLASKTVTYTAANSWGTTRANSTAYTVGQIVRPATGNGFLYRCAVAGTSDASVPTFSTVIGGNTTDGGVTWDTVGKGIIVLDAADSSWSTATFTGVRYAVISDRTPGTAATQPLLGLVDFVSDQAGGGGAFTIQWDAQGVLQLLVP